MIDRPKGRNRGESLYFGSHGCIERPFVDELASDIQRLSFEYFLKEANPENGLIADRIAQARIAAVGLALSSYPVGVEHGFIPAPPPAGRTLATLRFFWNAQHGPEHDATGYMGLYYHFRDMETGRRVWNCDSDECCEFL